MGMTQGFDPERLKMFMSFVIERWWILQRRQAGIFKPWTADEILRTYKFCNVYREDDPTTIWIAENWRSSFRHEWFATVVARFVNWVPSLVELGFPVPWNRNHFVAIMKLRDLAKQKIFSAAYLVNQRGGDGLPKYIYLADQVLTPIWEDREKITAALQLHANTSLRRAYEIFFAYRGMGSFMAAQIVADLKYTSLLADAEDWWTFAAPGVGSKRGLNRLVGRGPGAKWDDADWLMCLQELRTEVNLRVTDQNMPTMHAQDLQNCLCEWDKYERTRLGQGRPRSTYPG